MLLKNRRLYVIFQRRNSKWKRQNNGLPQGSVLAPMLFNVYTNDQPRDNETKHFLYADDLAAARGRNFEEVEARIQGTLNKLSTYYHQNHLKPNPTKTQVCAYHLRNKEAKRRLNIEWQGATLEHIDNPTYL